jgi:hypothetical protein
MVDERNNASQQERYIAFKTAFGILKHYEQTENFIAAYVIAFSILEDRIKAMYVVGFRHKEQREPKPEKITEGFTKLVSKILRLNYISLELANELRAEAEKRNDLLHAAMWKIDAFTLDSLTTVKKLVRTVDKALRDQKKKTST